MNPRGAYVHRGRCIGVDKYGYNVYRTPDQSITGATLRREEDAAQNKDGMEWAIVCENCGHEAPIVNVSVKYEVKNYETRYTCRACGGNWVLKQVPVENITPWRWAVNKGGLAY